jgi:hypothetical protein
MIVISTIMKDITKIQDTLSARLVSFLPRNATTVGTLKIEYHRIQALSQDNESDVHPRATAQAVASDHTSL